MNYTQFQAKKLVPMNALYVPSTLEVLCIVEKLIEGK